MGFRTIADYHGKIAVWVRSRAETHAIFAIEQPGYRGNHIAYRNADAACDVNRTLVVGF